MGDTAVRITFGPAVDALFLLAICCIIMVLGTTLVQWIYNDVIKPIINRILGIEPEELIEDHRKASVLYEVQYAGDFDFDFGFQTRIVDDPKDAIQALLLENGDGYFRYRPFSDEFSRDFGTKMYITPDIFRDSYSLDLKIPEKTTLDHAQQIGMYNYLAADMKKTEELFEPSEKTKYIVQWSNHTDFLANVNSVLTDDLEDTCRDLLKVNGSGYMRYRLAGDKDVPESWIPNGFVNAEEVLNANSK